MIGCHVGGANCGRLGALDTHTQVDAGVMAFDTTEAYQPIPWHAGTYVPLIVSQRNLLGVSNGTGPPQSGRAGIPASQAMARDKSAKGTANQYQTNGSNGPTVGCTDSSATPSVRSYPTGCTDLLCTSFPKASGSI